MLEQFPIHIPPFQQDRMIRVYLPTTYMEGNQHYPVLYMHDGQNVFHDQDAIDGVSLGLEAFLDERRAEVIVVSIATTTVKEDRINEYCPWLNGAYSQKFLGYQSTLGGIGGAYVDFIVEKLKPLIDEKYRTLPDRTYMAGISLGGLLATYAVCRYPHIFKRIAAISSGYYRNQEAIEEFARQADLTSVERIYMDVGSEEAGDEKELCEEFIASNQAVYDILKEKVPNIHFQIFEGCRHHYRFFRERVPNIFSYLLDDK